MLRGERPFSRSLLPRRAFDSPPFTQPCFDRSAPCRLGSRCAGAWQFDIIFKDNEPNELGPAYHDYKDGKIDIERVWRPTKKLTDPFLESCCHVSLAGK